MSVFVDTSALMAVIVPTDDHHPAAARTWTELVMGDETLVTSSYVLVELAALLQRRFGLPLVRRFEAEAAPVLSVVWVSAEQHEAGVASLLAANRRELSLVDCVSFRVMRELGIVRAFALDEHFAEQGFEMA